MKKIICLVLITSLFILSGCVNQKPMKTYWDGDVFVVENGDIKNCTIIDNGDSTCFIRYPDLESSEQFFKSRIDSYDKLIVLAKKEKSISYNYSFEYGKTYTDISIEKVLWSSSEEIALPDSIKIVEPYYYTENDDGELILTLMGSISVDIILNDDAEYYILYLTRFKNPEEKELDGMYYGTDWFAFGFMVNASIREDVSKGETISYRNYKWYEIGSQAQLYNEVYEKYVD